jgi:hypothetical protein
VTKSVKLAQHLINLIDESVVSAQMLSDHLGYKYPLVVRGWLEGVGRPSIGQLKRIADFLDADLIELMMGWMIEQAPELEEVAWAEVLSPRGSKFPRVTTVAPERPLSIVT